MVTSSSSLLLTIKHDDAGRSKLLHGGPKDRLYNLRIREVGLDAEEAGLVRDSCREAARCKSDLVAVGSKLGGNGIAYVRASAQNQRYFRHAVAWDNLSLKREQPPISSTSIATECSQEDSICQHMVRIPEALLDALAGRRCCDSAADACRNVVCDQTLNPAGQLRSPKSEPHSTAVNELNQSFPQGRAEIIDGESDVQQ